MDEKLAKNPKNGKPGHLDVGAKVEHHYRVRCIKYDIKYV
jgi:hypothetical protein